MHYDARAMHSRTPAGRRVGYFSCVGVKLLVVYSVVHDMINIPAGRRFVIFKYFGDKFFIAYHMITDTLEPYACRQLGRVFTFCG